MVEAEGIKTELVEIYKYQLCIYKFQLLNRTVNFLIYNYLHWFLHLKSKKYALWQTGHPDYQMEE